MQSSEVLVRHLSGNPTNQKLAGTTCLSTHHLSTAVNSYPANIFSN